MQIEVTKTLLNGVGIKIDAENPKTAFHVMAVLTEALGETRCGACGSEEIAMEHRMHDNNSFYSYKCQKCGCQLDMGQPKTGKTLFPKRTLPDGSWDNKNHGWYNFLDRRKTGGGGETPAAKPTTGASDFF